LNTGDTALDAVGISETPSQIVAAEEVLAAVRAQLSTEEQYLVDQKMLGRQWADLASELGGTAEALRKRTARALDRAARSLGFVEGHHAPD
jgi:hypothetical protein